MKELIKKSKVRSVRKKWKRDEKESYEREITREIERGRGLG